MNADVLAPVIDNAGRRARMIAEDTINLEMERLHSEHDVQWTLGTGKVSVMVMRLTCLTCQEETSWSLDSRLRKLRLGPTKPYYGPPKRRRI